MASLEALRAANAVSSRIDRVNAREVARKAMLEPGDDSVHVLETPAVAVGGLPTARVPEAATVRAGKTSIDVMAAASTRVVAASTGVMVVGAKQRHDQLDRKKAILPVCGHRRNHAVRQRGLGAEGPEAQVVWR